MVKKNDPEALILKLIGNGGDHEITEMPVFLYPRQPPEPDTRRLSKAELHTLREEGLYCLLSKDWSVDSEGKYFWMTNDGFVVVFRRKRGWAYVIEEQGANPGHYRSHGEAKVAAILAYQRLWEVTLSAERLALYALQDRRHIGMCEGERGSYRVCRCIRTLADAGLNGTVQDLYIRT